MFFSAIAFVAALKMRESAARPLLGSAPVVTSAEEAAELAKGQDDNDRIDTATMLLVREPASREEARVS
jgi:MHS family proline/betaine transporter-like MFS transporter